MCIRCPFTRLFTIIIIIALARQGIPPSWGCCCRCRCIMQPATWQLVVAPPVASSRDVFWNFCVVFWFSRHLLCVCRACEHVLGLRDSDSNAYSDSDSHSHSLRGKGRRSGAMCVCCLALIGSMESNWCLARLAALCSLSLQIWVMWLIGKDWRIVVLQVRPRFSCCLHAHNEEITRNWKKTGTT